MDHRIIAVLGAGSWGTALAVHLNQAEHQVRLWGRPEDGIELLSADRVNTRFLPDIFIPESVDITSSLNKALENANIVVMAVPSQALRTLLNRADLVFPSQAVVVNTAKGIEINTNLRLSQVAAEVRPEIMDRYVVLSGPSHAEEVARSIPTAVVASSKNNEAAGLVQDAFMLRSFRVYTNYDVIGVELGGALKNIIALTTGISEGLGFGDNTKAALVTRGLTEMTRMGVHLGAEAATFAGLTGLGDLVVTCSSKHSRNGRAGFLIGQGIAPEEAVRQVGMVVEGITTTRAAHEISRQIGAEMPITNMVYQVLFNGHDPREAVWKLMERDKRDENQTMEKFIQEVAQQSKHEYS